MQGMPKMRRRDRGRMSQPPAEREHTISRQTALTLLYLPPRDAHACAYHSVEGGRAADTTLHVPALDESENEKSKLKFI